MDGSGGDAARRGAESSAAQRRLLVVFNPVAGGNRRARFDAVIAALAGLGVFASVVHTQARGHAEAIAREAADDFDAVVAAGGDGTINEVVNGLKGKPQALGVIPLGTANVLADEIGLSKAPSVVARSLVHGAIKPIHVGLINGRRFVMMAGAGFDADVVAGVSLALKRRLGPLAYVWQAARQAFRGGAVGCTASIDGVAHPTASAVACNGRLYGGPFIAAPKASLADDTFEVVLMRGHGAVNIARYGAALMLGIVGKLSDVDVITAREVLIEGAPGRPVQADGDIIATLPARISIDPEPVHLIHPL